MPRFRYWSSKTGSSILERLLAGSAPREEAESLALPAHEWVLIDHAVKSLLRRGERFDARSRARERHRLATELDAFRRGNPPTEGIVERLQDRRFKGKRAHLVQLLAARGEYSDRWNRWRRRVRRIDLRGADLYDLDLRGMDLSHADLRGADLSAVIARTALLRHADLRGCTLRHADFSYGDLNHVKLSETHLLETMLTEADLRNANLKGATLIGTSMNGADLRGANLSGAVIWGVSAWDVLTDDETRQNGLIVRSGLDPALLASEDDLQELRHKPRRRRLAESRVDVDGLAAATFVGMMLTESTAEWVIRAPTNRFVLLLGRFEGSEGDVLDELEDPLRRLGWVPVKFDFPELDNRDMIETVAIMAGLSCFIVANLSNPRSVALESLLVTQSFAVPFVPILRKDERQLEMFDALQSRYDWVLETVKYRDIPHLLNQLGKRIIEPARAANERLRRRRAAAAAGRKNRP